VEVLNQEMTEENLEVGVYYICRSCNWINKLQ